jgi:hypothetical protein
MVLNVVFTLRAAQSPSGLETLLLKHLHAAPRLKSTFEFLAARVVIFHFILRMMRSLQFADRLPGRPCPHRLLQSVIMRPFAGDGRMAPIILAARLCRVEACISNFTRGRSPSCNARRKALEMAQSASFHRRCEAAERACGARLSVSPNGSSLRRYRYYRRLYSPPRLLGILPGQC